MSSNKKIVIIGSVIIGCIMLFTAIFLYFGAKDVADLKKQLSDLEKEQKELMLETTRFDKSVETEDVAGRIKDIMTKGNKIADIENQMMKFEFENSNPIDAAESSVKIDAKVRKELHGYFPKAKSYLCESSWFIADGAKCKFEPVFQYKSRGVICTWTVSLNNRILGFATAEYDPDKKVFTDLKLYKSVYGGTMAEDAYTKMVKRAGGIIGDDDTEEHADDPNYDPNKVTPEEAEADPFLDPDGDGYIGGEDPLPDEHDDSDVTNTTKEGE